MSAISLAVAALLILGGLAFSAAVPVGGVLARHTCLKTLVAVSTVIALGACGGSSVDCTAKRQAFIAALVQAQQCTPAASLPCAAYPIPGVDVSGTSLAVGGCSVGVNPDATSGLDALLAEDAAAGCPLLTPCLARLSRDCTRVSQAREARTSVCESGTSRTRRTSRRAPRCSTLAAPQATGQAVRRSGAFAARAPAASSAYC